jgi:hypothetical protein
MAFGLQRQDGVIGGRVLQNFPKYVGFIDG